MFDGHGFGIGGGFMWFFWILLIVVVVWAVRAMSFAGRSGSDSDKSPLEILRKRFARGEIDEEEFERKRKLLEK